MRKTKLFIAAACASALMCMTSFAGEWKQDTAGWWYQNDDGTYAQNAWVGNYYCGNDGYMLVNTTTPDGYAVGADGAWIDAAQTATEQPVAQVAHTPTLEEKNALGSAETYLMVLPFSHDGLVEQLEYEGFSTSAAVYAADNCGADWNEQAANKAQTYMQIFSFSRRRLIEQLEYDGFTSAQAEYGAKAVGY